MRIALAFRGRIRSTRTVPDKLKFLHGTGRSKTTVVSEAATTGAAGISLVASHKRVIGGSVWWSRVIIVDDHTTLRGARVVMDSLDNPDQCFDVHALFGFSQGGQAYTTSVDSVYCDPNPFYSPHIESWRAKMRPGEALAQYAVNLLNDSGWEPGRNDAIANAAWVPDAPVAADIAVWWPYRWLPAYWTGSGLSTAFIGSADWPDATFAPQPWMSDVDEDTQIFRPDESRTSLVYNNQTSGVISEEDEPPPTNTSPTTGGGDSAALENRLISVEAKLDVVIGALKNVASADAFAALGKQVTDGRIAAGKNTTALLTAVQNVEAKVPTDTQQLIRSASIALAAGIITR